jgi:hypothetical protein
MSGAVETQTATGPESVERKCDICGAEIRQGSQFCYNCGSEIREVAAKDDEAEAFEDGNIGEKDDPSSEAPRAAELPPKPVRLAMRRQRAVKAKEITVRWEEPDGIGVGSIAVVALIVALAAVLIAVGFYIR